MVTIEEIEEYARHQGYKYPKLAAARMRITQLEADHQRDTKLMQDAADTIQSLLSQVDTLNNENAEQSQLICKLDEEVLGLRGKLDHILRLAGEALIGEEAYAEAEAEAKLSVKEEEVDVGWDNLWTDDNK